MTAVSDARIETLREYAAKGKFLKDAANHLGVSYSVAGGLSRLHKIKFKNPMTRDVSQREMQMAALFRSGKTLQEIGDTFGITRERVRQLLARVKVSAMEGGQSVRAAKDRLASKCQRDQRYLSRCGCTFAEHKTLIVIGRSMVLAGSTRSRTPLGAFCSQRSNAGKRGIGWGLTLWQWWTIWQTSGHWESRGRGNGYVMCRRGDVGSYALGNVFIATARQNSSDGTRKNTAIPMGVQRLVRGKYQAYTAHICRDGVVKRLGSFKTSDEAHAAYLLAVEAVGAAA